jgi:hypothetical protein
MPEPEVDKHDGAYITTIQGNETWRYLFIRYWQCQFNWISWQNLEDRVTNLGAAIRDPNIPMRKMVGFSLVTGSKLPWIVFEDITHATERAEHKYPKLSHVQRISFAKGLGKIYRSIAESAKQDLPAPGSPRFRQLCRSGRLAPSEHVPVPCSLTRRWMVRQVWRSMRVYKMRGMEDVLEGHLEMLENMDQLGLFFEDRYIFWPTEEVSMWDVHFKVDGDEVEIITLFDPSTWWRCCSQPLWAVCMPPDWLWAWQARFIPGLIQPGRIRGRGALLPAFGPQNQAIRQAFFDAAGPLVERYAKPEYGYANLLLAEHLHENQLPGGLERRTYQNEVNDWKKLFQTLEKDGRAHHTVVGLPGTSNGSLLTLYRVIYDQQRQQHESRLKELWARTDPPKYSQKYHLRKLLDQVVAETQKRYTSDDLPLATKTKIGQR